MLLSQIRKGEDLYFLDLNHIENGIQTTKVIYAGYKPANALEWGCGCTGPEDTWTLRFDTEFGEKIISFHHANTAYHYLDFKNLKNKDGLALVNKYRYLISADKKTLIKEIKRSSTSELDDMQTRVVNLETQLAISKKALDKLESNMKLINELK